MPELRGPGAWVIEVSCFTCGAELVEPGALVIGRPFTLVGGASEITVKRHVCVDCWAALESWMLKKRERALNA